MTCIKSLNDEIYNVILKKYEEADIIWKTQDIELKYKNVWVDSIVKQNSCYYLCNKWFERNNNSSYEYNDDLCEILNICKKNYIGIDGSRIFPLILYQPKMLLKYYIYNKCEELLSQYKNDNFL